MQDILENTQFIEMVGTLFYCILSLLVIWIIVKIYGITGNPLLRALDNISAIKRIIAKLRENLAANKNPNIEEIAEILKKMEKYNEKLVKNLSAFQYDHNNIVEIGNSKSELLKIKKTCLTIIENLSDEDDNNNSEIITIIDDIEKTIDLTVENIELVQRRQARRQMIQ